MLPRLYQRGLEAGEMVLLSSWLPVLRKLKAGQQYLVETSVCRIPAALLPANSVWAGPTNTLEGVLQPWEAYLLTWPMSVRLAFIFGNPSSQQDALLPVDVTVNAVILVHDMLMKDSQAGWWCKCPAALFTLVLTSWFLLTQALEYLFACILHGLGQAETCGEKSGSFAGCQLQ